MIFQQILVNDVGIIIHNYSDIQLSFEQTTIYITFCLQLLSIHLFTFVLCDPVPHLKV
jgi:hypothetical protein